MNANISLLESNKYFNPNNNLIALNAGLNSNFRNDIKLYNEPFQNKINFLIQTQENKNKQNMNLNNIVNNEIDNITNKISFNVNHINTIDEKNNKNLNNNSAILPNFPNFFNDNKENKNKDNQTNNNYKLNESNGININKENNINQNNDILNVKDSLIFNNNSNYFLNNLNQTYNKILFPGFTNIFNYDNNLINPMNIFPYFSYLPLNQKNNFIANMIRNENIINNNLLGKKSDINK